MDARVVMHKKDGTYEWLVIDADKALVLESFPAGNINGAHEAMDRYNAEAENACR